MSRPRSWPCSEGLEESLQSCFTVATSTSPSPSSDPRRADSGTAARSAQCSSGRWSRLKKPRLLFVVRSESP